MAAIHDLLAQIQDESLRKRIEKEINKISQMKKFGLVFEEHLPECTPLYDMPIIVGVSVMRRNIKEDNNLYTVLEIEGEHVICGRKDNLKEKKNFSLNEIVRVAEFGEPIYPYLKPVDRVCNAPESDLWHILIEADNYHALQVLEYLYTGKVDCIYIDPPYNSGAKDWKYNNDYVDSADSYRHSKWLSMMEKRLKIAKRVLNPRNGVLIVTIDEKEYLHLGCLIEEIFPEAYIQMVTIVINPKGSTRGRFSRVEEYAFYCFMPEAFVTGGNDPMLGEMVEIEPTTPRWKGLLRSGIGARRVDSPNLFYPILIDQENGKIIRAEEPLELHEKADYMKIIDGYKTAWPIRKDMTEGRWMLGKDTFNSMLEKGYIKLGKYDNKRNTWGFTYLSKQYVEKIENGELIITGRTDNDQTVIVEFAQSQERQVKTVWHRTRHDAGVYGSDLVSKIIGRSRAFSYPKSLYAVIDSLSMIVKNRPNALILDFFAGSGTTLHAVNILNATDNGNRRCILVTNNEVSNEEANKLTRDGFKPGSNEWEKYGIAQFVTWPRTVCSIIGKDVNGNDIEGTYLGLERAMSQGFQTNAQFLKLGFLDKTAVSLGMRFKEIIPLLWMKSGAYGMCPELVDNQESDMLIMEKNRFAVLIDEKAFIKFKRELMDKPAIQTAFIITNYETNYQAMANELNIKNTFQMYRDYLDNFRINHGRN